MGHIQGGMGFKNDLHQLNAELITFQLAELAISLL